MYSGGESSLAEFELFELSGMKVVARLSWTVNQFSGIVSLETKSVMSVGGQMVVKGQQLVPAEHRTAVSSRLRVIP